MLSAGVANAEPNPEVSAGAIAETAPAVDPNFVIGIGAPAETTSLLRVRHFSARPFGLEARFGMATIVGAAGLTASISPWSWVAVGGGVGANPAGLQVAAFLRARPLVFLSKRWARLHAVGAEMGYSTGPFNDFHFGAGDGPAQKSYSYSWDRVHWLQPLLVYETQSYRGFNLLAGFGLAIPVARSGYHCEEATLCQLNHLGTLPTLTAGVGYFWSLGP